ncbi:MAG: heme-binding protein [Candidatus Bathyarchaeota archaeon]|nr:heme-binding protein [Candidatus Bathyarchaeota archaeon]
MKLTLEGAKIILAASEAKAKEIGVPMSIAIVDDGCNLIAFEKMDSAKITSIDIAINKAFTSAGSRKGTHEYAEVASPGKPAFGIHVSNQGRFTIFGGGLPILIKGEVVGGVGCSSGTAEQDREVAQAGLAALSPK